MLVFCLAAFLIGIGIVVHRDVWPAHWLKGGWHSARAYVVSAPASYLYVMVIGVTTVVLLSTAEPIATLLLTTRSSTLHVMFANPGRAFVQSAFWVATPIELPLAIVYATLLAPVERWLGSLRWAIVAAIGHVLATLFVAVLIWVTVKLGWAGSDATRGVDVGVSYAFGSVAGAFAFLLHGRLRWLYPSALLGCAGLVLVVAPSFTAVGHILAIVIGLGVGRYFARRVPRPASTLPVYQRPLWRP